jgi:hypothetical protein
VPAKSGEFIVRLGVGRTGRRDAKPAPGGRHTRNAGGYGSGLLLGIAIAGMVKSRA